MVWQLTELRTPSYGQRASGWARVDPIDRPPFHACQEANQRLRDDCLPPLRLGRSRRPRSICFSRDSRPQIPCTGWILRLQSRCSSVALAMSSLPKVVHGLPTVCLRIQGVYLAADYRARCQVRWQHSDQLPQGSMFCKSADLLCTRDCGQVSQRHHSIAILSRTTVAHTSLFHWVTALGRHALQQMETLRADFAPASRKYTSERRRSILIACRITCSVLLSDQAPSSLPCG